MPSIGLDMIVLERQRQVVIGYTIEHDDTHTGNELGDAALCYLRAEENAPVPKRWPFDGKSWKPSADRLMNLTRAGALYQAAAEQARRRNSQFGMWELYLQRMAEVADQINEVIRLRSSDDI